MKIFLLSFLVIYSLSLSAQIPNTWVPTGIGGGGSLFAPTINPANDSEYYISSDLSAIYHTTNAGASYNILNGQQIQGFHYSTVCFTSTPGLLYSINYANDNVVPVSSADNGQTWNALQNAPITGDSYTTIFVDYNTPTHIVLGYYGEIYFSNNGGNTFDSIHEAVNNGAGCIIGGVFFDGNNIYIGTNDGIIYTTTGNIPFTVMNATGIPPSQALYSFGGARSGDTTRFFCLTGLLENVYNGLDGSDYYGLMDGVYTMDNANGTWVSKMNDIDTTSDFMSFVGMANNDINTCYLAGGLPNSDPEILKTTNGGNSWASVFNVVNNENIITGWFGDGGDLGWDWSGNPFGFAVAPNNSKVAVMGDYAMPTTTYNGGATWEQAYESPADDNPAGSPTPDKKSYHSVGMNNTTCWQVYWVDSLNMFGAYTDIVGARSKDGGDSWSFDYSYPVGTNTTYRIAHNISNSYTLYAAISGVHDMYQGYKLTDAQVSGTGEIIFSTDSGSTWQTMHNFNAPVYWIATDPNNSDVAYASVIEYGGVGGIYVCNNLSAGASSTWTLLPAPPRTQGHPATVQVLNNGNVLCSFSGRMASGAFTQSSGVFLYSVSDSKWTDVSAPGMEYYTRSVTVDPNDATQQTWYACVFNGWGGNGNGDHGVYKTTNGGASWALIFNQADIFSCDFSPANPDLLYVCTDGNGLWASSNVNDATPVFNLVDSYLFANPVRVFFNPYNQNEMWVSTFGYGMNIGTTSTGTGLNELRVAGSGFQVYPNPTSGAVNIILPDNPGAYQVSVFDVIGTKLFDASRTAQDAKQTLDLSNVPAGVYFLQVMDGGKVFNGKVVKE